MYNATSREKYFRSIISHNKWDSFAPRLKCYKNASRLNRYNFPTDNVIDLLFSALHTTPFHYKVLKKGSQYRYPLGSDSDSNAMHFYNITLRPWGNFRGNCPKLFIYLFYTSGQNYKWPHDYEISMH